MSLSTVARRGVTTPGKADSGAKMLLKFFRNVKILPGIGRLGKFSQRHKGNELDKAKISGILRVFFGTVLQIFRRNLIYTQY